MLGTPFSSDVCEKCECRPCLCHTTMESIAVSEEQEQCTAAQPTVKEPVLCYVEGNWAYFTTKDLDKQWGDDWDDAPYEHNAGTPYGPCWHNEPSQLNSASAARGINKETGERLKPGELCRGDCCVDDWDDAGNPLWEITCVAWKGDLETPDYGLGNSPFSVQQINAGAVAWLRTPNHIKKPVAIPAGTTLSEFKRRVKSCGGTVYTEDV